MNNNLSLYKIAEALTSLEEMTENDEQLVPFLDSVEMQLNNKVDNIVKFRQNLLVSVDAIDNELERLIHMKQQRVRLADRLKEYISNAMLNHGIEKIETDLFKVSFRNSTTTDIVAEDLIPLEYIKVKEVKTIDKISIKKDIENGVIVPGVQITEHKNIQIK